VREASTCRQEGCAYPRTTRLEAASTSSPIPQKPLCEKTERQLLAETDWRTVWGYDSQLYMPILHVARMNCIPVVALDVERALTSRVGKEGWTRVPADQREGIGDPAAASDAYTDALADIYAAHGRPGTPARMKDDPAFQRFRDVQVVWDRAFAEGPAAAHRKAGTLAIGISAAAT
jgi:hypothetical protein